MEEKFEFALDGSLNISGKIDRLDITPQGALVTDYKYSANVKARLDDPNLLQAPLYLLAAERAFGLKPARMDYVGLKGGIKVVGWELPFPDGFLEQAIEKTLRAAGEIRAGRIEPAPADPARCRYCDCRDVCRIETHKAAVVEEAEGA
jgi:RecB family exonuclease